MMRKICLILAMVLAFATFSLSARASGVSGPATTNSLVAKSFIFSLAQNAGTYTIGTVAGGDILIQDVTTYVVTSGTGLTSLSMATSDTSPTTILGLTLAASLTGGKNLTLFNSAFYLPSGKTISGTIIGNGTGGSMIVVVRYTPMVIGAVIQ